MGQLIRARQRAITAILPHPGNTKILVPSRFGMIPDEPADFKVTQLTLFFGQVVTGTLVTDGFTFLVDGAAVALLVVSQPSTDEIGITYALQTVTDSAEIRYDGSGDWIGANGFVVGAFAQSGVIV